MTEPTPDERTAAFVSIIAPMLEIVAKKCLELGMPLSAMVEVGPTGECAHVFSRETGGVSLNTFFVRSSIAAAPNLDAFVIGMAKFCKANKIDASGSIVMTLLENHTRH